jgi:hypothetical protein
MAPFVLQAHYYSASFEDVVKREDKEELLAIRQSLANLEINEPKPSSAPAGLHHGVLRRQEAASDSGGHTEDTVVFSLRSIRYQRDLPDRNWETDIYPNEREIVVVDNNLEVQRWKQ